MPVLPSQRNKHKISKVFTDYSLRTPTRRPAPPSTTRSHQASSRIWLLQNSPIHERLVCEINRHCRNQEKFSISFHHSWFFPLHHFGSWRRLAHRSSSNHKIYTPQWNCSHCNFFFAWVENQRWVDEWSLLSQQLVVHYTNEQVLHVSGSTTSAIELLHVRRF